MNRTNVFLSGILVGAIVATLGFVVMKSDQTAHAEANGEGAGSLILATPSSSSSDVASLVYVMKTSPPEDAQLAIYRVNQGKELHLVASRRIVWDLKAYDYTMKQPLSVAEIKKVVEAAQKDEKDKEKK